MEALHANSYGKIKSRKKSLGKENEKNSTERCFSREILIYCQRRYEVLLFHWFAVLSSVIISSRGAICLRTFTRENLAYDFRRNTSTLSEFIGYSDSTDFREMSPEQCRDNSKPKRVGKFWYLTYFSRGVHLRHKSHTFLATPTKGQVALEDRTVYLCQKCVITMKNQVRPVCSPKDKIWSQTDKLQRCRRLPLEQAKLKQILENISEGVLIRKLFDKWYATSLCAIDFAVKLTTFSFRNNMNPGAGDQYFPYEMGQQFPQYPPGWIYPMPRPYHDIQRSSNSQPISFYHAFWLVARILSVQRRSQHGVMFCSHILWSSATVAFRTIFLSLADFKSDLSWTNPKLPCSATWPLRCRYLDNQSEYRKRSTRFCWLMPCE